jgi:hypothetical protein
MVALGNKPQFACMANHVSSLPTICLDMAQLYRFAMFLVLYVDFESCFRTPSVLRGLLGKRLNVKD